MASREQIVAACDKYLAALSEGDVAGIMSLYSEDATVEDPVGSPLKVGHAAIREFYDGTTNISLKATRVGPVTVAGSKAAFLFRLDVSLGDQDIVLASTDVMTFDDAGKVVSMVAIPDGDAYKDEPAS
jgi:steroid delta-isomerase